jgi:hypothetical protein
VRLSSIQLGPLDLLLKHVLLVRTTRTWNVVRHHFPFGDNQTGVPAGQSNIVGALID